MEVELRTYNPHWPQIYILQAERVRRALGCIALDIEHVGSTAVPGLLAKPVININVAVEDSRVEGAYAPPAKFDWVRPGPPGAGMV